VKTQGTSTATEAVVSPTGTFSESLTVSGFPVSTGTGSSVVSIPVGRVPFGDSGSLLTSDSGLTFDATYGELTVGPPLTTALLGRQTQDSTIIINAETGADTRARQVFAQEGRSRFEWLYTPTGGDPGLHFLDVDKIVNRITVSSGTNSTLHRQLHLDADGRVHFSNQTLTTSGAFYPQTRGIGIDGNVTATGTIAGDSGRFGSSVIVGRPVTDFLPVNPNDAGVIIASRGGASSSAYFALAVNGTTTDYLILYTEAPGDPGLHFYDVKAGPFGVNRITVSTGTNSSLQRQLHLLANGSTRLSSRVTASGSFDNHIPTEGLGVDGNITATGTVAGTNASFSAYPGMVEEIDGQWTQPSTGTLCLVRSASYPFSIQSFTAQTVSNSTTSSLTKEGVVITGIDNKTINTTEATYFPTSTANVAVGETLRLTSSGSTGAEDLSFTLKMVRL